MRKIIRRLIYLISLFNVLWCINAASWAAYNDNNDQKIYVIAPENDPLYKEDGLIRVLLTDYFRRNLRDYTLSFVDISYHRFWHQANLGNDYCNMFGIPWTSDTNTIVSENATLELPKPTIIMTKETAAVWKITPEHDAFDLLTNDQLIGAYTVGRRLHTYIDQKIIDIITKQPSALLGSHFSTNNIEQMLERKRIDYFIGLPSTLGFINQKNKSNYLLLDFKTFKPSQLRLVCGVNKKNKRFIERFDNNIRHWYQSQHLEALWFKVHQDQSVDPSYLYGKFISKLN